MKTTFRDTSSTNILIYPDFAEHDYDNKEHSVICRMSQEDYEIQFKMSCLNEAGRNAMKRILWGLKY